MRKIKEALHRHPTTGATTTAPGTLANEPVLGGPSYASTGLAPNTLATASGVGATTVVEQQKVIVEETRSVPLATSFPATTSRTVVEEVAVAPIVTTSPALVEVREKAPVVQEVIRPGVREEIQPVVHRDREQLEIREEIQPIYETNVRPTVVEQRELAPQMRADVRTGIMPVIAEGPRSNVITEAEHVEVMTKAPIVEEIVHKKIIEEVQPVIHRETIAPKVIQEVQPIYEKVIEAPVVTYTTLPAVYSSAPTMVTAPVVATPPLVEQVSTTTTVVEKQFIPGSTGLGTRGTGILPGTTTGTTLGAPVSSMGTTGYGTTSGLGAPMMGTPGTTGGLGAPMMPGQTSGLGQTATNLGQDLNAMKLEEQRLTGQAPSSFKQW